MRTHVRTPVALVLATLVLTLLWTTPWAEAPDDAAKVPSKIPAEAKAMKNPQEATEQSIADGKQIYSSQCAMCHGATGDGQGDLATRFGYEIPDFSQSSVQQGRTDGEWFFILTNGHGKMSGEGKRLSETTRWNLVNYIRTLGPSS
jgi:mono/diheme cytochrome c family protein